ncbi:vWA domain-containing protein [Corynebacterium glutamicum]|uniref:vWA domain-containing protein n=1 Tax=Corynebacterium glutamicum TaxID=1718 RepID=UPI00058A457B|nr:VWA domain-containing protein [Corynebacterium glutamicum]KIH73237.1 magnesium chelatase [Corynebacterium glutamicum]
MGEEDSTPGRRSKAYSRQGADVRPMKGGHGINLVGTLMAATERGANIVEGVVDFRPTDLRGSLRRGREANLIVFVVDTSGSMAARSRVRAVTGTITSMLNDAYQRRDKVAVIAVNGNKPTLVLNPTNSVEQAQQKLKDMPMGGRTPLAEGLLMAKDLMARERRKEPGRRAILMVMTDGQDTSDAGEAGIATAAETVVKSRLSGNVVIDCEGRLKVRKERAGVLAEMLGGVCVRLCDLNSEHIKMVINA